MEPVVTGDEPERQLVALRAALRVDPIPWSIRRERPTPQSEVCGPERHEEREEALRVRPLETSSASVI